MLDRAALEDERFEQRPAPSRATKQRPRSRREDTSVARRAICAPSSAAMRAAGTLRRAAPRRRPHRRAACAARARALRRALRDRGDRRRLFEHDRRIGGADSRRSSRSRSTAIAPRRDARASRSLRCCAAIRSRRRASTRFGRRKTRSAPEPRPSPQRDRRCRRALRTRRPRSRRRSAHIRVRRAAAAALPAGVVAGAQHEARFFESRATHHVLAHGGDRRQNDARRAIGEIGKKRYARAAFGRAFDRADRLVARTQERDAVAFARPDSRADRRKRARPHRALERRRAACRRARDAARRRAPAAPQRSFRAARTPPGLRPAGGAARAASRLRSARSGSIRSASRARPSQPERCRTAEGDAGLEVSTVMRVAHYTSRRSEEGEQRQRRSDAERDGRRRARRRSHRERSAAAT